MAKLVANNVILDWDNYQFIGWAGPVLVSVCPLKSPGEFLITAQMGAEGDTIRMWCNWAGIDEMVDGAIKRAAESAVKA